MKHVRIKGHSSVAIPLRFGQALWASGLWPVGPALTLLNMMDIRRAVPCRQWEPVQLSFDFRIKCDRGRASARDQVNVAFVFVANHRAHLTTFKYHV
jgi:hypothetical protein